MGYTKKKSFEKEIEDLAKDLMGTGKRTREAVSVAIAAGNNASDPPKYYNGNMREYRYDVARRTLMNYV